MNAYELAEKLLAEVNCFDHQCAFDAASMLRQQANDVGSLNARLKQQADRITELEKELYFKNYYEELPDTPVGIIGKIGDSPIHDLVHRTTPQIKELSDEEIQSIWNEGIVGWYATQEESVLKFARAILKKASEK